MPTHRLNDLTTRRQVNSVTSLQAVQSVNCPLCELSLYKLATNRLIIGLLPVKQSHTQFSINCTKQIATIMIAFPTSKQGKLKICYRILSTTIQFLSLLYCSDSVYCATGRHKLNIQSCSKHTLQPSMSSWSRKALCGLIFLCNNFLQCIISTNGTQNWHMVNLSHLSIRHSHTVHHNHAVNSTHTGCAETAELIEMPFPVCTWVEPKNERCICLYSHVFWGHFSAHCEVQGISSIGSAFK